MLKVLTDAIHAAFSLSAAATLAIRMSPLAPTVDVLLNDVLKKDQRTINNLVEWDKLPDASCHRHDP